MTTTISPTAPVAPTVTLTARQRVGVEQIARRQTNPQRLVRRAKLLLAMDAGANNSQIARQMHLNRGTVCVWRHRWLALTPKLAQVEAEGLSDKALTTMIEEVLTDHPRLGAPATFTAEQIVQIVAVACEPPEASWRPPLVRQELKKILLRILRRRLPPTPRPRGSLSWISSTSINRKP